MKLLITGLLFIILTSWLFAQDNSSHTIKTISPVYDNNNADESVVFPRSKADYQLTLGLGYGTGDSEVMDDMFIVDVINGFQLSPEFYLGIGTGVRLLSQSSDFWGTSVYPIVPVYIDARYFLLKSNISPYISLDAGYTWDVSDGISDLGYMLSPMAGFSFFRDTKNPLLLGIGYNSQRISNYVDKYNSNRIGKSANSFIVSMRITLI